MREWIWSSREIILTRVKQRTRRKPGPSSTLSANPIWTDLGASADFRGEKLTNNRLSYGTVHNLTCVYPLSQIFVRGLVFRAGWRPGRRLHHQQSARCSAGVLTAAESGVPTASSSTDTPANTVTKWRWPVPQSETGVTNHKCAILTSEDKGVPAAKGSVPHRGRKGPGRIYSRWVSSVITRVISTRRVYNALEVLETFL
jgi:hypothetical protein